MKKLEQKILNFIDRNNLISKGDKILVALSGGPDSVLLTRFLEKFSRRFKIRLAALHLNHRLRGRESDADEEFCRELTDELGIEFYSKIIDVKKYSGENKVSVEEAARELRYSEYLYRAEKTGCSKIATGHNINDNSETVLLNLIKGGGISGLAGIPVKRGNIIRPLLNTGKNEILDYLDSGSFKYRIDATNFSNDYERNFLRNKILPELKERINPSADAAILRSSEILTNYHLFVQSFVEYIENGYVKWLNGRLSTSINLYEHYGGRIVGEIFKVLLMKCFEHEFTFEDSSKIITLFNSQVGREIQLAKSLVGIRERGKIVFLRREEYEDPGELTIKPGKSVIIQEQKIGISNVHKNRIKYSRGGGIEYICADGLKDEFILRRWRSGDRFVPLGMKGSKKISDFLTESRIAASDKKNQLVLLNRNKIVWVVGLRLDNNYKITETTKKSLKLWVKKKP